MSKSWPLLSLAVLGAIAATFCLAAFDWMAWACHLPAGEEGKVLTPSVGGCIEFWLNRYQTLIGAITAVGAAALAWRGVIMQVNIGRRQSAIALIDVLNKHTTDVDALGNWVERAARYGKLATIQRKNLIKVLDRMYIDCGNPENLSKIYNEQFERPMKAHASSRQALEYAVSNVQTYIAKALISTSTKAEIDEFVMLSRHAIATEHLASDSFSQVVNIFDADQAQRPSKLQDLITETEGLAANFDLSEHVGVISARLATINISSLLNKALREAEGR